MESIGDLWQGLVFSLTLTRHMATERKRAYAQALAAVRQGMLDSEKEHSLPAFGRGLTACPSLWALLSTTTLYGAQRLGRVLTSKNLWTWGPKDMASISTKNTLTPGP